VESVSRTQEERLCWWCRERPANSREHKFKRSDLVREHGRGSLDGERELVHVGADYTSYLKSTKSKPLKFAASLCDHCNGTRSQPHDYAYDRFINWVMDHEQEVLDRRTIDLVAALGEGWAALSLDVLRYWSKHIGCRLFENDHEGFDRRVPHDLVPFLNGGALPAHFSFELWVEPAWLRFCEYGAHDPLWVRPLKYDYLYGPAQPGASGQTESIWRYGWLTMGWVFGEGVQECNPFQDPQAAIPLRAQSSADLEWLWGGLGRSDPPAGSKQTIADAKPIDPDQVLGDSPIAEAFTGGVLDFEAGTRSRQPDRRDPPQGDAELDQEILRGTLVVELAMTVWGFGELDTAHIRQIDVPNEITGERLDDADQALQAHAKDEDGFVKVASQLARLSGLKLLQAVAYGLDPAESDDAASGQEALRDAAELAGKSAAAAGLAHDNLDYLWHSVNAARGRLARLE
jgi:hypothetical protein